ncbi:MAG: outer membrane protein assembly factor BamE [Alphaproteobacteria bacterium]
MKLNKKLLATFFGISLSACTMINEPVIESHGFAPDKQDVKNISNSNSTKQDILNEYGQPFVKSTANTNMWYYISYQTEQYGFGKKEFKKFNLVAIEFNNDTVAKVSHFDKNHLKNIEFSDKKTDTSGKELGILDQIIGNIGKFRTTEKQTSQ